MLFLVAYTCSGFAGLVDEDPGVDPAPGPHHRSRKRGRRRVPVGPRHRAALVGRTAQRFTPARALGTYAVLELGVGLVALALPLVLGALTPLLRAAYHDGAPGLSFPLMRVTLAVGLVLLPATPESRRMPGAGGRAAARIDTAVPPRRLALAAAVLRLSGFAALLHEIAWTRILALSIGPTTYAFAAALAAVIAGSAAGSWIGAWLVGRVRQPALWLALTLAAAAFTASCTYTLAGRDVALYVATELARGGGDGWMRTGAWISTALVVPTALCLGLAFPLAIAVAGVSRHDVTGRVGLLYAVNTAGAVSGSMTAGFDLIPLAGLQATLQAACA